MQAHRRPRRLRHLGVSIALVLTVGLMAAPTTAAAGADVYGVGAGSQDFGTGTKIVKFAFSGHDGPSGDFGSLRYTIEDPTFPLDIHVDLDCVNVFANPPGAGGWLGGQVKKVTPFPNASGISRGDELVFGINDYGNPSDLLPDEINGFFGSPQVCEVLGPSAHPPISQGNINIKLAP